MDVSQRMCRRGYVAEDVSQRICRGGCVAEAVNMFFIILSFFYPSSISFSSSTINSVHGREGSFILYTILRKFCHQSGNTTGLCFFNFDLVYTFPKLKHKHPVLHIFRYGAQERNRSQFRNCVHNFGIVVITEMGTTMMVEYVKDSCCRKHPELWPADVSHFKLVCASCKCCSTVYSI